MIDEPPVLIWTPVGRDGPVIQRLLSDSGITSRLCDGIDDLLDLLDGAAGAVLAQEGLLGADFGRIDEWASIFKSRSTRT